MSESPTVPDSAIIQQILIEQIRPSAHQVRKDFDQASIKRLADSIEKEGLIQPVTIRKVNGGYELVAGERRMRAVKSLGRETIEARVIEVVSEAAASAKGLVENLQRKDLNPIEEAEGFSALNKMDPSYWTQEQISQVAGRDKGYISRSMSLLGLPEPIKEKLRARNFSRSHAVEFLRLSTAKLQLEALRIVEERKLSWENTRRLADQMLGKLSQTGDGEEKSGDATVDPLASLWPQLLGHRAIEAMGGWVVKYRKGHWNFSVSSAAVPSKEALAAWFIQMASALTVASIKNDDTSAAP